MGQRIFIGFWLPAVAVAIVLFLFFLPVARSMAAGSQDWIEPYCDAPVDAADGRGTGGDAGVSPQLVREAQNLVRLIITNAPVYDPIQAVVVERDDEQASAWHCANGRKLILFGTIFIQNLRSTATGTGPYWSWVFVAAHEIGHIWRNHGNLRLPCQATPNATYCPCRSGMPEAEIAFNHKLELEADYFAGFVLARLGAGREAALSAMHILDDHDNCTHPSRSRRAESVTRGWQQAKAGGGKAPPMRGSEEDVAKFELIENRDIYGGDIRELFGISLEACARQCLLNDRCAVFSFDRWYNGCFLKSKFKLATTFKLNGFPEQRKLTATDLILKREPKSTLAIRRDYLEAMPGVDPDREQVWVRLKDRSFFDKPYRTTTTRDWSDCRSACRADGDQCLAFNFSDGFCELLSKTDGPYPSPGRGAGYVWTQNR